MESVILRDCLSNLFRFGNVVIIHAKDFKYEGSVMMNTCSDAEKGVFHHHIVFCDGRRISICMNLREGIFFLGMKNPVRIDIFKIKRGGRVIFSHH